MFASPVLAPSSAAATPLPRRVTYIIPAPTSSPPLLSLPPVDVDRRGHTAPLYTRAPTGLRDGGAPSTSRPLRSSPHPRHRLAVQALALDLSTVVSRSNGSDEPAGILYTGARDGLLCSWELDLPVKKRRTRYGQPTVDLEDDDYDELGSGSDDDDEREAEAERRHDPTESEMNGILELDDLDRSNRSVSVQEAQNRARSDSFRRGFHASASTARGAKAPAENRVNEALPIEERWEIDDDRLNNSPRPSRFRQCIQSHTDWVNDIVLCNSNQTLVSASSDSLVLAWNPHASSRQAQVTPQQIGKHTDYVRCLTAARDAGWVASGGFDRKINLWDLGEGREKPIIDLTPPASIYSLSSTPSGSLLAAGTPERVVRVWDPRSRSQVARLGGHTDNVRAVLLAEEGKWLLSASSDATVKLWSLAAQKCLHTFSHHSESVWSLFSQHASLEIFYSGDRVGNLCKIDLQGTGEPGEGECVLLARDCCEDDPRPASQGISQIVAQDDAYVWTAGSSSTVKRWRDCPPRLRRAGAIPTRREGMTSVVSLSAPLEEDSNYRPMTPLRPESSPDGRERSAVVSFAESLTSGLTRTVSSPTSPTGASGSQLVAHRPSSLRARVVPSASSARRPSLNGNNTGSSSQRLFDIHYDSLVPLRSPEASYFSSAFLHRARDPDAATIYSVASGPSQSFGSRIAASASPSMHHIPRSLSEVTRENNLARREYMDREDCSEATPLRSSPDDVIEGGQGLTRCELLNDRRHALTIDTEDEVALWDIIRCECLGVFEPQEVQQLRRRPSDAVSSMSGSSSPVSEAVSSADLLDSVRERIEGEGAVATWCKCDARTGSLVVHLEEARVFDGEVYADEAMQILTGRDPGPEHRIILGKWVLRNLFDSFIEAELELRAGGRTPVPHSRRANGVPNFISLSGLATAMNPARTGLKTPGMTIALATPALNPIVIPAHAPPSFNSSPIAIRSHDLETIPQSPTPHVFDAGDFARNSVTPGLTRTPAANGRGENDYFSLPTSPNDPTTASPVIPSSPGPLPTPGGSLMGRLRNLGKASKKANVESTEAPAATSVPLEPEMVDTRSAAEQHQHQVLQTVFSRPLTPCEPEDAPTLTYPSDTAIIISEGAFNSSASSVIYRGLVGTGREDLGVLEQKAPLWLLDFLLGNRAIIKEPVKLSFLIQPWTDENGKSDLPELPNSNARLTANRTLRLRKVVGFVADKLNLGSIGGRTSISSSNDPSNPTTTTNGTPTLVSPTADAPEPISESAAVYDPEKELEILVGDVVLPGWSTIASARTFHWKNGGDLVLHYRFKRTVTV